MKKVYILLFLSFIFISCSLPEKSYFNILSANKENDNIKVIVEAAKSGRQSENIFLVSQFMNDDDVIVNTSMSQIGPMMFDAGKYEFNVPLPTNSFTKYTNFIEYISPEKAQRVANNSGFGNSFFTYWMLMNLMDSRRPVYYDSHGSRRTINKDYYDNRHTTYRRSTSSTPKKTTVDNNNSSSKRRTLYKPSSGSSTRKQSTFRRSSTRRRR